MIVAQGATQFDNGVGQAGFNDDASHPDRLQQLVLGQHLPRMPQEMQQDFQGLALQLRQLAAHGEFPPRLVKHRVRAKRPAKAGRVQCRFHRFPLIRALPYRVVAAGSNFRAMKRINHLELTNESFEVRFDVRGDFAGCECRSCSGDERPSPSQEQPMQRAIRNWLSILLVSLWVPTVFAQAQPESASALRQEKHEPAFATGAVARQLPWGRGRERRSWGAARRRVEVSDCGDPGGTDLGQGARYGRPAHPQHGLRAGRSELPGRQLGPRG